MTAPHAAGDLLDGNKVKAAKRLGISRTQLYGRLRRFGLESV
jgi:transcriptional regulator of acetoin/glycerol metabolism